MKYFNCVYWSCGVGCQFDLNFRDQASNSILGDVPSDSLTPHVLMTVLEARSGHRHVEIPVQHRVRRGDSEVGTTWRGGRDLVIPMKLVRFLGSALRQLVDFRRAQ